VDLIKMDVEGAEELVVRGANKVVSSYKPTIIFEVNQEAAARLGPFATRGMGSAPEPRI